MAKKNCWFWPLSHQITVRGFFLLYFQAHCGLYWVFLRNCFWSKTYHTHKLKKNNPLPQFFLLFSITTRWAVPKIVVPWDFVFFEHNKFSRAWCIYIKCLYILMPILLSMEYYVLKSTTIQKYLFWIMHPTI